MRVLFDTNVYISYLLRPDQEGIVQTVIEAGFEGKYILLLPQEVINELSQKLESKKYLLKRISPTNIHSFINSLITIAKIIPAITDPIPRVTRDYKDDYLLAYALVGEADYLVSGDLDVLTIKKIQGVTIISPAEFYEILMG